MGDQKINLRGMSEGAQGDKQIASSVASRGKTTCIGRTDDGGRAPKVYVEAENAMA